jgi:hypothetical protein
MRLSVDFEFDFGRGQLQRARLRAPPPQDPRDDVHLAQIHAQLVVQSLVIYARLRLCICQRRPTPVRLQGPVSNPVLRFAGGLIEEGQLADVLLGT